jgi:uncharacterized protein (DUF433 family)
MEPTELIVRDRRICGGDPVFRGTRVPLRTVLAGLADGDSEEDVLRGFPTLSAEHAATLCPDDRTSDCKPSQEVDCLRAQNDRTRWEVRAVRCLPPFGRRFGGLRLERVSRR